MGNPVKSFAATARLATPAYKLPEAEQNDLSHGKGFYRSQFGVRLDQIQIWNQRKGIDSLLDALDFIKNKRS